MLGGIYTTRSIQDSNKRKKSPNKNEITTKSANPKHGTYRIITSRRMKRTSGQSGSETLKFDKSFYSTDAAQRDKMKKEVQTKKRGRRWAHAAHVRANKGYMFPLPSATLAGPVPLGPLVTKSDPGPTFPDLATATGGSSHRCFSPSVTQKRTSKKPFSCGEPGDQTKGKFLSSLRLIDPMLHLAALVGPKKCLPRTPWITPAIMNGNYSGKK